MSSQCWLQYLEILCDQQELLFQELVVASGPNAMPADILNVLNNLVAIPKPWSIPVP